MFRWLMVLVVLAAVIGGAVYVATGRSPAPSITIDKPDRVAGQKGTLEITVGAPDARLTSLVVSVEQDGRATNLFSLDTPGSGSITEVDADRLRVTRPFGTESVPALRSGAARIVVSASRPSFLNLHTLASTASKDIQIDLEPPRIAVASTKHYVNHGGSELVLYRTTPADAVSGVRVGDMEYPGYPASGAGLAAADPALRVAFFALLHDQDLKTPIAVFARDEAGNEATAPFVDDVFEKPFRRSRIVLDDTFLQRVVPEILAHSPELNMPAPSDDVLPAFLKINGELRRLNADRIAEIVSQHVGVPALAGPLRAAGQLTGRGELCGSSNVSLPREGSRSAGTPRVRPRGDRSRPGRGSQCRQGAARSLARHLRELRHRRSRHGPDLALRTSVVVRGEALATW